MFRLFPLHNAEGISQGSLRLHLLAEMGPSGSYASGATREVFPTRSWLKQEGQPELASQPR